MAKELENTEALDNDGTDTGTENEVTAETNINTGNEVVSDDVTNTKDDNNEVEDTIMIPKHRFDEVNDNYKAIKKQLDELKNSEKESKKEEKKEVTKVETEKVVKDDTSEVVDNLSQQVKHFETLISDMVSARVEEVPEDMRDLIPEGLSDEDKLSWIDKASEKGIFAKEEKAKVVVGQPMNHSANEAKAEDMKKMNPIQLLASYYGK